jgi:hypothetical protein
MTIFCLQSLFLFERKKSFLSDFSFFVSQIGSGSPPPPAGEGRCVESLPASWLGPKSWHWDPNPATGSLSILF